MIRQFISDICFKQKQINKCHIYKLKAQGLLDGTSRPYKFWILLHMLPHKPQLSRKLPKPVLHQIHTYNGKYLANKNNYII